MRMAMGERRKGMGGGEDVEKMGRRGRGVRERLREIKGGKREKLV